ncbi:MAG: DinB family protein [Candidatus Eisenbacteria bacterium]
MDATQRNDLIARYRAGFAQVLKALEGFPAGQLTAHPIAGKWSAAEIVHHLADSEMNSAIRLRKLLAEAHPVVQGYDQELWAEKLHYQKRPIEPSLQAFRYARESTAQIFEHMSEADWRRLGWHTDAGSYHTERWLELYAAHAHGHAEQIERLKAALAK